MEKILTSALLFLSIGCFAQQWEYIWQEGKTPDAQEHQIALMTNEKSKFKKLEKYRTAYLDWFTCSSSKGGQRCLHDPDFLWLLHELLRCQSGQDVAEKLTELGFQCVKLVYRTPRSVGLPIYQSA